MRNLTLLLFAILFMQQAFAVTEEEFGVKLFGGAENLSIIKNAQKVTATVLIPPVNALHPETLDMSKMFDPNAYKQGSKVTVSTSQLAQLRTILLDRTLDNPNSGKSCIPIFHIRFTFITQIHSVDIDLCFQCDLLFVSRDGKQIGGEDFDHAHGKLLELCRALFPNDKNLRELTN